MQSFISNPYFFVYFFSTINLLISISIFYFIKLIFNNVNVFFLLSKIVVILLLFFILFILLDYKSLANQLSISIYYFFLISLFYSFKQFFNNDE